MPNKYEREIEEILRNLERSQPRTGFRQGIGGRMRRSAGTRRSMPAIHLSFSEWCLIIACAAALAAGGWAYANGPNLITGIIALVGLVCVVLVALSSFLVGRRSTSSSMRYNNVTPLRSNPLRRITARWHLLMLKLRYRNQRDRER